MVGPYPRSCTPATTVLPALLLVLAALAPACRAADQPPVLSDLNGIETLRAQFNADAGKPRVVLLLSPT